MPLNFPPEVELEAAKAVAREQYNGSLYLTSRKLLGYMEVNHRTHGDMIRALEAPGDRKLIVMPRGTFKSTIGCVGYPIWLLNRNPDLRILLDSEVYTNSKNFLRVIKAHMMDPALTRLYGDYRMDSNWTEGEVTIKQRKKALKEASISCGGIGTVKVGQHYDVIIGDDYNSGNNSETPEAREKVVNHYRLNLSILEPGGTYVIIGTRYAVDDIIGWILENEIGKTVEEIAV